MDEKKSKIPTSYLVGKKDIKILVRKKGLLHNIQFGGMNFYVKLLQQALSLSA